MGVLRESERPSTRMTARFVVLAVGLAALGIDSSLCQEMPPFQPWPPPVPSDEHGGAQLPVKRDSATGTRVNVDRPTDAMPKREPLPRQAAATPLLGDVHEQLVSILNSHGQYKRRSYGVPNGFALVVQWDRVECEGLLGTFKQYLTYDCSGHSHPTHYRVILFIVTDQPFPTPEQAVSYETARAWGVSHGLTNLSGTVATQSYAPGTACYIFAYLFDSGKQTDGTNLGLSPSDKAQSLNLALWSALRDSPCAAH
jgi:hypothetical protein